MDVYRKANKSWEVKGWDGKGWRVWYLREGVDLRVVLNENLHDSGTNSKSLSL